MLLRSGKYTIEKRNLVLEIVEIFSIKKRIKLSNIVKRRNIKLKRR